MRWVRWAKTGGWSLWHLDAGEDAVVCKRPRNPNGNDERHQHKVSLRNDDAICVRCYIPNMLPAATILQGD